ncbi:hypothetical protein GTW51_19080 [Aurantimonas aggregata]|uniref:IraD/Gp25-like domain-containing protein n=1 Tax=Aurantimonas aggregata TaxID=2047720 RepID=A0A6L9MM73_9HYPH|nr:GPW/gp25 family protein [Aurantimonas aggregata]NDV88802.1 hypothetical protein [Aurantimonas aggregata]
MDFDRRTGAVIDNYASALQSVEVILTTRVGELVMLREFGAAVLPLLGRLMTPQLFGVFRVLLAAAIDLWEPRFRVRRVDVEGGVDALRAGIATIGIEVDWRPRGHLGDETVEGVRSFALTAGATGIIEVTT